MELDIYNTRLIKNIRQDFHEMQKNKGNVNVIIVHCIISLYNPCEKRYEEWNLNEPAEWFVQLYKKSKLKKQYLIRAKYDIIEKIMAYLYSDREIPN